MYVKAAVGATDCVVDVEDITIAGGGIGLTDGQLRAAPVVTAPFTIGNAKFARLVPTTAGTGIVADTYELSLTAWE